MKIDAETRNELLKRLDQWYEKAIGNDEKSKFDQIIFKKLYSQLLSESAYVDWNKWSFIKEEVQKNLDELPAFDSSKKTVLDRLVVVRLNGGLGTSMGCQGPKSFIEVKDGLSFLDLALKQIKLAGRAVRQFEQSRCPRIYSDTLLPVEEESERWYPPGHGNIFASLEFSGELDRLLAEGRDIIFVSNIDNTGAVIEPAIAQFFVDADAEYAMECTLKTQADIKGGTLIEIDNHIMHLEIPQVPPEHIDDFCSTKIFKIFNTNNIWVNLRAVKRRLEEIRSEIIVNKKKLSNGREVIQLETSIGGSIRAFERAYCIHVPRARFLPVKKTDDLLTISSDLYKIQPDFSLKLSRSTPAPFVSLSSHFQEVDNFQRRFKNFPKMDGLSSLIVEGDVWFEEEVTLIGDVKIKAKNGERLVIDKRITLTDCEYSGE